MAPARLTLVARKFFWIPLLALALAGCGGDGTGDGVRGLPGEVSGIVFDDLNNVVRDARVYTVESPVRETQSNSAGSYVLTDVPSEDLLVRAEVTQNGIRYVGQNLARVFEQDRAKNVNIVVVREGRTARIRGTVRLVGGGVVEGARVFALGENNLSSSMAITDRNGEYSIELLSPDVDYVVLANTPGARSDGAFVSLSVGETETVNLYLDPSSAAGLFPPTGLTAIAWTSPYIFGRSTDASAIEQVKREFDPDRAKRVIATRGLLNDSLIEIDLEWDPIVSDWLLGYGIYRGPGGGQLSELDFVRDPLAEFFADADDNLQELQVYSYAVTAFNTDQEESGLSGIATVETLGKLEALSPLKNPLRFRWNPALGADQYIVYLFSEEPKIGVSSIWNNENDPTVLSQYQYTGPSLISGRTYYFLVLGYSNDGASRTISEVVSFVAN